MPCIKDPLIRERNATRIFGCNEVVAIALNKGLDLRDQSSLAMRYYSQRQSSKKRGIAWQISFPEWVAVWMASGFLDQRGVGIGSYCMARHGDEGPYSVENVAIKPSVVNSSEGITKTIRAGRLSCFDGSSNAGKGRGWTKRKTGKRPYQVLFGSKYIGVFATEQEARAAYLVAAGLHVGAPFESP